MFETASGPLQLDPTVIWDQVRLRSQVGDPGALFLAAIGEATMRKLIDHGVLMNVEAGQVLTKQGLVQPELFVIVAGQYEVHDGMRRLRVVGPESSRCCCIRSSHADIVGCYGRRLAGRALA